MASRSRVGLWSSWEQASTILAKVLQSFASLKGWRSRWFNPFKNTWAMSFGQIWNGLSVMTCRPYGVSVAYWELAHLHP